MNENSTETHLQQVQNQIASEHLTHCKKFLSLKIEYP